MKKITITIFILISSLIFVGCAKKDDSKKFQPNDSSQASDLYEVTYIKAITEKNSFGSIWVSAIGEVLNTSTVDLYMSDGTIDLFINNEVFETLNYVALYPQVISPGEKAYYYQTAYLGDNIELDSIDAVLKVQAKKSKIEKIAFEVSDIEIHEDEYLGVSITGTVENKTEIDKLNVLVAVVLFNKDNHPIAVMPSFLSLLASEKSPFITRSLFTPEEVKKIHN